MTEAAAKFTSRKWLLVLAVVAIACAARWRAWIDGAQFVALLEWIVGLYMLGNVGSAVAGSLSITATKPEAAPPAK